MREYWLSWWHLSIFEWLAWCLDYEQCNRIFAPARGVFVRTGQRRTPLPIWMQVVLLVCFRSLPSGGTNHHLWFEWDKPAIVYIGITKRHFVEVYTGSSQRYRKRIEGMPMSLMDRGGDNLTVRVAVKVPVGADTELSVSHRALVFWSMQLSTPPAWYNIPRSTNYQILLNVMSASRTIVLRYWYRRRFNVGCIASQSTKSAVWSNEEGTGRRGINDIEDFMSFIMLF